MALRHAVRPLRRMMSTSQTQRLPFEEKPLLESEILTKAKADKKALDRLELYGNIAVLLVAGSVCARIGYYIAYGKKGGAAALPRRNE